MGGRRESLLVRALTACPEPRIAHVSIPTMKYLCKSLQAVSQPQVGALTVYIDSERQKTKYQRDADILPARSWSRVTVLHLV